MSSNHPMPRRVLRHRSSLILAITLAVVACNSSSDDPPDSVAFSPAEAPLGRSYGNWGAAWWQWVLNIPEPSNPLLDESGAHCAQRQDEEAWFLAGNFGGSSERACTISAAKSIFFPIVNGFMCVEESDPSIDTVEKLRPLLNYGFMNASLNATLDGAAIADLSSFRATSDVFTLSLGDENVFGEPPMDIPGCLSDGYWIMLKPLPPGPHTLRFGGETPNTGFSLDVTYHLNVTP
jgi:hypothetical protein